MSGVYGLRFGWHLVMERMCQLRDRQGARIRAPVLAQTAGGGDATQRSVCVLRSPRGGMTFNGSPMFCCLPGVSLGTGTAQPCVS